MEDPAPDVGPFEHSCHSCLQHAVWRLVAERKRLDRFPEDPNSRPPRLAMLVEGSSDASDGESPGDEEVVERRANAFRGNCAKVYQGTSWVRRRDLLARDGPKAGKIGRPVEDDSEQFRSTSPVGKDQVDRIIADNLNSPKVRRTSV